MTATQTEFMPWTDAFLVGEHTIDSQHRMLVSLVNRLYKAMRTGRGQAELRDILSSLVQYTQTHFRYEESVMRQKGYPGLKEHIGQHHKLEGAVLQFQQEFEAGAAGITLELLDFLSSWLRHHILDSDKKCAALLGR